MHERLSILANLLLAHSISNLKQKVQTKHKVVKRTGNIRLDEKCLGLTRSDGAQGGIHTVGSLGDGPRRQPQREGGEDIKGAHGKEQAIVWLGPFGPIAED